MINRECIYSGDPRTLATSGVSPINIPRGITALRARRAGEIKRFHDRDYRISHYRRLPSRTPLPPPPPPLARTRVTKSSACVYEDPRRDSLPAPPSLSRPTHLPPSRPRPYESIAGCTRFAARFFPEYREISSGSGSLSLTATPPPSERERERRTGERERQRRVFESHERGREISRFRVVCGLSETSRQR